jgi:hypothetical protein
MPLPKAFRHSYDKKLQSGIVYWSTEDYMAIAVIQDRSNRTVVYYRGHDTRSYSQYILRTKLTAEVYKG